jgi:glycosyltransferase involved in cell wall biosynthesis
MSNRTELSVVVPCYNEEKNIPLIVNRFSEALNKCAFADVVEIILVNNGSRDQTAAALNSEISKSGRKNFKVETVPVNQGYGFGILSGLKVASGDVLSWTHADMQTDPYDVIRAFEVYKAETAQGQKIIVKGRRVGRAFGEWAFTLGMSLISSTVLTAFLYDINAQPKLFSAAFFRTLKNPPFDFSLDLFLIYAAKKAGYRVRTIDVTFGKRIHGESKWAFNWSSKYKTILRTIKYIFALRKQLSGSGALEV